METDKASQNAIIQREVEALRSMGRVGTGAVSMIQTRAFGGEGSANGKAQEEEEQVAASEPKKARFSLFGLSILQRYRGKKD